MPAAENTKRVSALLILDAQGLIVGVDSGIERALDYSASALIGRPVEALIADVAGDQSGRAANISIHQRLRNAAGSGDCRARVLRSNGESTALTLSVNEIELKNDRQLLVTLQTPARAETGERLQWAYEQRSNLVREVHHRIKNNLQSVTGLLRRQIYANPAASDTLRQAITQVEAIAVVHGLESSAGNRRIRICEILCGIVSEANKLQTETDSIKYPAVLESPALVRSEEAVPIALILSELLTNAIKHHCPLHARDIRIDIERSKSDTVRIAISNPAQAPKPGFDFANGKGIGQGLKLVRAMMPKEHMHINFDYRDGNMTATITLSPPIIYADVGSDFNESPNPAAEHAVQ